MIQSHLIYTITNESFQRRWLSNVGWLTMRKLNKTLTFHCQGLLRSNLSTGMASLGMHSWFPICLHAFELRVWLSPFGPRWQRNPQVDKKKYKETDKTSLCGQILHVTEDHFVYHFVSLHPPFTLHPHPHPSPQFIEWRFFTATALLLDLQELVCLQ